MVSCPFLHNLFLDTPKCVVEASGSMSDKKKRCREKSVDKAVPTAEFSVPLEGSHPGAV